MPDCSIREPEKKERPTLFDLVRAVSDEARSDAEVVEVVADLFNRSRIRFEGLPKDFRIRFV